MQLMISGILYENLTTNQAKYIEYTARYLNEKVLLKSGTSDNLLIRVKFKDLVIFLQKVNLYF